MGPLITAIYRIPPNAAVLRGAPLTLSAVRNVLSSRLLWRNGLAFFGGYGAYFTSAQLLRVYATSLHVTTTAITWAVVLIAVAGIPGASSPAGYRTARAAVVPM